MRVELYVLKVSNVRYESRIIRFILVLKQIIDIFTIGNTVARIVTGICWNKSDHFSPWHSSSTLGSAHLA